MSEVGPSLLDPMAKHSSIKQTAERALEQKGTTLAAYLRAQTAAGMSDDAIARDLAMTTNGLVGVVGSTVRRWISDLVDSIPAA